MVKYFCVVMMVFLLAGCDIQKAMQQDIYSNNRAKTTDGYMYDAFAVPGSFAKYNKSTSHSYVSLKAENFLKISKYKGGAGVIEAQQLAYDVAGDDIAKAYIDTCAARGSSISVYKAPINKMIIGPHLYSVDPNAVGRKPIASWNNVLVEFAPDGRMMSALTRHHRISEYGADVFDDMYSTVVFGAGIQRFEQSVSKRELDDYFVRKL